MEHELYCGKEINVIGLYKHGFKHVFNDGYKEIYNNPKFTISTVEDLTTGVHTIVQLYDNERHDTGVQLNIPYKEFAFESVYNMKYK